MGLLRIPRCFAEVCPVLPIGLLPRFFHGFLYGFLLRFLYNFSCDSIKDSSRNSFREFSWDPLKDFFHAFFPTSSEILQDSSSSFTRFFCAFYSNLSHVPLLFFTGLSFSLDFPRFSLTIPPKINL